MHLLQILNHYILFGSSQCLYISNIVNVIRSESSLWITPFKMDIYLWKSLWFQLSQGNTLTVSVIQSVRGGACVRIVKCNSEKCSSAQADTKGRCTITVNQDMLFSNYFKPPMTMKINVLISHNAFTFIVGVYLTQIKILFTCDLG